MQISRRGLVAAAAAATLAARQGLGRHGAGQPAGHLRRRASSTAGGATLRVASWGGFWEEMERKHLLDQLADGLQLHDPVRLGLALVPQVRRRRRRQPAVRRHELEPAGVVQDGEGGRGTGRLLRADRGGDGQRAQQRRSLGLRLPVRPRHHLSLQPAWLRLSHRHRSIRRRPTSRPSGRSATRTSAAPTSPRTPCR